MKNKLRVVFLMATLFAFSGSVFSMKPKDSYCGYFVWSTMTCYDCGCENCTGLTMALP